MTRVSMQRLTLSVIVAGIVFVQPREAASVRLDVQGGADSSGWRQWGGPHRNFVSDATELAENASRRCFVPDPGSRSWLRTRSRTAASLLLELGGGLGRPAFYSLELESLGGRRAKTIRT